MSPDNINFSTTKYKSLFAQQYDKLFHVGRKFTNHRHLEQYLTVFLKRWSILKHRDGYTFECFYSQGKKKKNTDISTKTTKVLVPSKTRDNIPL